MTPDQLKTLLLAWLRPNLGLLLAVTAAVALTQVAAPGQRWWLQAVTTLVIGLWQRKVREPWP